MPLSTYDEPSPTDLRRGFDGESLPKFFSKFIEPVSGFFIPHTRHLSSQTLSETRSTTSENIPPTTSSEQPVSTEVHFSTTEKPKATASSTTPQPAPTHTQSHSTTSPPNTVPYPTSVSTLTSQGPTTTIFSPIPTTPSPGNRPPSFFQKKGVVAGVFSGLGCVLIALLLTIILLVRRWNRIKRLQDGEEDTKPINVRENSWSTAGEAPLTSIAPPSSTDPQRTMSTMLDSYPGSHLMHHLPPPPAYTESQTRPTVSFAHELGTQ